MPPVRACDICYKRKIQCSTPTPEAPCDWCSHHDLPCTFSRGPRKNLKNSAKLSDVQELFRRIEQLESMLAQHTANHPTSDYSEPSATPTTEQDNSPRCTSLSNPGGQSTHIGSTPIPSFTPGPNPQLTNLAFGQILFSGSHLGQNWLYKGFPILSEKGQQWISEKTDQPVTLHKYRPFGSQSAVKYSNFSALQLHISSGLCELPDKAVAQNVLDIFFRSAFRLFFPVIGPVLFKATLGTAYDAFDGMQSSQRHISAKACVLAVLAMMSRVKGLQGVPSIEDGDIYAGKAQCLLGLISGDVGLESLQTILMIQKHQTVVGQWQNAMMLHSTACRIVGGLGGHVYHPMNSSGVETTRAERQSHHIRMLFWLCYMSDKDISLRFGHPPLLTEDYCDLTPPENYITFYTHSPGLDETIGLGDSTFHNLIHDLPGDPRLSHLKEKTCRLLYSPQSYRLTDSQLLSNIRQLDGELECWRLSIPPNFRPQLSVPPGSPLPLVEMGNVQGMRYINLQLEYHYIVTAIHSTVRRCPTACPLIGNMPEPIHQVVHSSIDLSLEASRSTIRLLEALVNILPNEAFWVIVYYHTVAAISLFVNVLLHPTDVQVQADMHLLASVVGIIQCMPMHSLTGCEVENVEEINKFVMELVLLGNAAIVKARREESDSLI